MTNKFTFNPVTGNLNVVSADSVGVPVGGSAGQVLAKDSGTDYDTAWVTPAPAAPGSGLTGRRT